MPDNVAKEAADRVPFLDDGVVLEQGPPATLSDNPREERTQAFLRKIIETGRL